jgi:hypothetical protein
VRFFLCVQRDASIRFGLDVQSGIHKHLTIVKYTGAIVGREYEGVLNDYDFMRRKRNNFIYEPDIPCSLTEAKNALETARKFILLIDGIIKRHKPQREIDLSH